MTSEETTRSIKSLLLHVPDRAAADVVDYRSAISATRARQMADDVFRAFRATMGVYEERQPGHFMARTRLPAGLILPDQMRCLARLASTYGNGSLHVTTRQDIQIHDVSLDGTLAIHEALLEVGMASSASGGNAVRNVSACPRSSVCPKARFDVVPYALKTGAHLLSLPIATGLPRKFKVAFSACSDDCAFASVNDVGLFAHEQKGRLGFAVYAGGGLGHEPRAGELVDEFVPAHQAPLVAEALLRLFARLGDRSNRNRARLRFVLAQLGPDRFRAEYESERATLERAAPDESGTLPEETQSDRAVGSEALAEAPQGFLPERSPQRLTLELRLPAGKITSADFERVAAIAEDRGVGLVGATQQQDLLVFGLARDDVPRIRATIAATSIPAAHGPKVVACVGCETCRLGLCPAPRLAEAIHRETTTSSSDFTLRISGCPNSCANHTVAALGFEGRLRKQNGVSVAAYEVLTGGHPGEGNVHFSERLGTVAAAQVPALVTAILGHNIRSTEQIRALVQQRKIV